MARTCLRFVTAPFRSFRSRHGCLRPRLPAARGGHRPGNRPSTGRTRGFSWIAARDVSPFTARPQTCPTCCRRATSWSSTTHACCRPGCISTRPRVARSRCCSWSDSTTGGGRPSCDRVARWHRAPVFEDPATCAWRSSPTAAKAGGVSPSTATSRKRRAAAAAVHPLTVARGRAVSDRVRAPRGVGRSPDRGLAPHARDPRPLPGQGHRGGDRRARRRARHVPSRDHSPARGPHDALRGLRRERGDARRVPCRGTRRGGGNHRGTRARVGGGGTGHRRVERSCSTGRGSSSGSSTSCSRTSTCRAPRCSR